LPLTLIEKTNAGENATMITRVLLIATAGKQCIIVLSVAENLDQGEARWTLGEG